MKDFTLNRTLGGLTEVISKTMTAHLSMKLTFLHIAWSGFVEQNDSYSLENVGSHFKLWIDFQTFYTKVFKIPSIVES